MGAQEDILATLKRIEDSLIALPAELRLIPRQITIVNGLSDISESLGTVIAGEFRAGNGADPGSGFSGMRMSYPAMYYDSDYWNLVGVNNDVMQFGVKAEDGKLYAGGGKMIVDVDGITLFDALTENAKLRLKETYGGEDYYIGQLMGDWSGASSDGAAVWLLAYRTSSDVWADASVNLIAHDYTTSVDSRVVVSTLGTVDITAQYIRLLGDVRIDAGLNIGYSSVSSDIPENGIIWLEQASPTANPPSGRGALYCKTDGNLYYRKSDGTEYQLTPVPST